MIKIKDLPDGSTIEYADDFQHDFILKKDGRVVKRAKTQTELEDYLARTRTASNKLNPPIKVFQFDSSKGFESGLITSANIPENSFWMTWDDEKGNYPIRSKKQIESPWGKAIFELTEKNQVILKEIKMLTAALENKITKEFFEARQNKD